MIISALLLSVTVIAGAQNITIAKQGHFSVGGRAIQREGEYDNSKFDRLGGAGGDGTKLPCRSCVRGLSDTRRRSSTAIGICTRLRRFGRLLADDA